MIGKSTLTLCLGLALVHAAVHGQPEQLLQRPLDGTDVTSTHGGPPYAKVVDYVN